MKHISTVIIGAGQCGLAMSYCLNARGIDHVVLERGEVANSWKSERWDSLRLLTPNWQSRLPGMTSPSEDPDGFRTMPEVAAMLDDYATSMEAPVHTRTTVTSVCQSDHGFKVATGRGDWQAASVVIASGACNRASVPAFAREIPRTINQIDPLRYRNPSQLADGGVLVVGASATGVQLAQEIHASERPVTLAVGEHVRAPRTYRGRDIKWWMDAIGILDTRWDETEDLTRARLVSSIQLQGASRQFLDLNALRRSGVTITGRVTGIENGTAQLSGGLANVCALADLKMNRLLVNIDSWADKTGLSATLPPPERFDETVVDDMAALTLDLERNGIRSIVWATGFRPDYSWLNVPVLDAKDRIRHDGGVTPVPGLYVMGLPFLRTRKSSLIDGAGDDARELSVHLARHLTGPGNAQEIAQQTAPEALAA